MKLENDYEILVKKLKVRMHIEMLVIARRRILKWILQTCGVRARTELTNLG